MLVLSQKDGEQIAIDIPADLPPGTRIVITTINTRNGRARLGLDAPRECEISRVGAAQTSHSHDTAPAA